ncbi:MAG: ABC transporter permease [Campylobacterota bacterium]|nr:ABC transporter permease [Campylobacterota bacterium]
MPTIAFSNLAIMLLPLIVVGYFYSKWADEPYEIAWATLRMIVQLLMIGFVLTYLFSINSWLLGAAVILFMTIVASWIVMRSTVDKSWAHFFQILIVIFVAGTINLLLVLYAVMQLDPLYQPKFMIPIAGMIYANAMNVLALFIERLESELKDHEYEIARSIAFKAAMIPQINTFLAVGLVSLPGMMTGQILSGVDPLIAVRYQIVVMAMVLGSAGISIIFYCILVQRQRTKWKP